MTQDLTQHVSVQKSPRGMNLHHSDSLLSSAFCYPGMIPHNPTEMAMRSNLSVTSKDVGFPHWFYIFCSVFRKRVFILNLFVNVHLFA